MVEARRLRRPFTVSRSLLVAAGFYDMIGSSPCVCRYFSAHGAASEIWKATNPLESCPRSQSHASRKGRYLAGWRTRGMPGGVAGRIGEGGALVVPHHTLGSDAKLRPR